LLIARAIRAHHPRREEIHLVHGCIRSELGEAHEHRLQEVLAAATPGRVLEMLDAIPKTGRSDFGRANEAAESIIQSVIPEWRSAFASPESEPATATLPAIAPVPQGVNTGRAPARNNTAELDVSNYNVP
jgi:hypothetical protein